MFTGDEDVEATALKARGWSISAIARHLGRDPKTVRKYLSGGSSAGMAKQAEPDPFEKFVPYLKQRLCDDPHVWASALFDEVQSLGFTLSYPSFTRGLRAHSLRPHCEACAGVKGRATIEIEHPPGEEIQWDWDELGQAPWGDDAHLFVGSLPYSGKFRGFFAESEEQPLLIESIDEVLRRFGGTAHTWRFDRMATVINPNTGKLQSSFAPVAKHYGVSVVACPPRRGNRKGSVEKSIHFATQRFWRTMTATTIEDAQRQLDSFCEKIADKRLRSIAKLEKILGKVGAGEYLTGLGRTRPMVADLASLERLLPLPASCYPAMIEKTPTVQDSNIVAFEGNGYSVPPGLIGTQLKVRHRLGSPGIEVISPSGILIASHYRQIPGGGYIVRSAEHDLALQHEVLSQFTTQSACKSKLNRPPSDEARAQAKRLLSKYHDDEVVIDLSAYQAVIEAQRVEGGQS